MNQYSRPIDDIDYELEGINIALRVLKQRKMALKAQRYRAVEEIKKEIGLPPPPPEQPKLECEECGMPILEVKTGKQGLKCESCRNKHNLVQRLKYRKKLEP